MVNVYFKMTDEKGDEVLSSKMSYETRFKNGKINKTKEKKMLTTIKRMKQNINRQYPNCKLSVTFVDTYKKKEEENV